MKLAKLRGAIRSSKGNPSVTVELTPGDPITLMLQKTPLLAELGRVYADADDTSLTFDPETGVLRGSGVIDVTAQEQANLDAAEGAAFDEDDEDML